ncbi:hypothetical protein HDU67_000996 [Dinochytrium kinnereticum]|nr:hypothetical protein HDU67_000996 [Dinochytrium kinnereticum]
MVPKEGETLETRQFNYRVEMIESFSAQHQDNSKKGFISHMFDPYVFGNRSLEISVLDLDTILELLRANNDHLLPKSNVYKLVGPLIGGKNFYHVLLSNGILASSGSKWRSHRNLIEGGFKNENLKKIAPGIVELTDMMLDRWSTKTSSFDCRMEFLRLTLQVITSLGFGFDSDEVGEGLSVPLYEMYRELNENFTRYALWQMKDRTGFKRNIKQLDMVIKQAVKKARETAETKRLDEPLSLGIVMDTLLKRDAITGNFVLSPTEIEDEVKTLMFAGHDTTGNTLSWAMHVLATNHEVRKDLEAEIEELFPNGKKPTMSEVDRMPYLNYFVKEDALTFNPWRWSEDSTLYMDRRIYIPFSMGPRNCVGMKMALLEIRLVLVRTLQRYRIEYAGEGPPASTLTLTLGPDTVHIRIFPK